MNESLDKEYVEVRTRRLVGIAVLKRLHGLIARERTEELEAKRISFSLLGVFLGLVSASYCVAAILDFFAHPPNDVLILVVNAMWAVAFLLIGLGSGALISYALRLGGPRALRSLIILAYLYAIGFMILACAVVLPILKNDGVL